VLLLDKLLFLADTFTAGGGFFRLSAGFTLSLEGLCLTEIKLVEPDF